MLVGQQDRRAAVLRTGADVDPGGVDEPGADTEPAGRVVVAAGHDDAGPRVPQAEERVVVERDRVDRRHGPVEDVARDEHGVDALLTHDVDEVVEVGGLCVAQVAAVQGAAQVPVGGVEQAHAGTVGPTSDSPG